MKFILTPFGSGGDVYPFIWMGKLLRDRGHRVDLVAAEIFRAAVEKAGLGFVGIGTAEDYLQRTANPDIWHPTRGPGLIFEYAGEGIRKYFDAIVSLRPDQETVLVGSSLALGTRLAREKFGLRMITVHLQPSTFLSALDFPVFMAGLEWLCRTPLFVRRLFYAVPNPMEKILLSHLRRECQVEQVPRPKRIFPGWWNSPDGVVALFSETFAGAQADWPANTLVGGFPLYDLRDQWEESRELGVFLGEGEPPLLFTAGTAMKNGHLFFETALEACRILKRRALLVTGHPEQLPADLPDFARHESYVPFGRVLPRCAALVSHGGVGTISQGLAAGVPQLLMPMAHDQPDNLNRLRRLGVGDGLYPRHFTPEQVAEKLGFLLESPSVAQACGNVARKISMENRTEELLRFLEGQAAEWRERGENAATA